MSITIILILTMLALVVCAYAPLPLSKPFNGDVMFDAERQHPQRSHAKVIPDDEM